MAQKAVIDAVENRINTRWNSIEATLARAALNLPGCEFFGINLQGDTPEDGSEFGQVQYPVANVRQMDLAASYYREEGTIRLIVNAQRGGGIAIGLALTDQLAALFRGKKFEGVQTFAPTSPVIDDRNDDGLYFPISISVPFQFDFTDTSGFYA